MLINNEQTGKVLVGSSRNRGRLFIHCSLVAIVLVLVVLIAPDRLENLLRENALRLSHHQATPSLVVPLILQGINLLRLALLVAAALYVLTVCLWNRAMPPAKTPGKRVSAVDLGALLVLFTISSVLRLGNITASFWWDELTTIVRLVRRGVPTILFLNAEANNHILNSLLVLGMSKMMGGEAEWAMRIPSLVLGVLTPLVVYWAARYVLTRPGAFGLGLLFAVQFRCVMHSAEARGYAGALALSIAGCFLFYSLWANFRRSTAVLYVLVISAAVGFQFLSIFVPIAHGIGSSGVTLYALWRRRSRRQVQLRLAELLTSVWGALGGFLIYAVQLPQLVQYSHQAREHMQINPTLLLGLGRYLSGGSSALLSCLVILCAAYGWTRSRDLGRFISLAFPGLFILMAFAITRTPGSPRLFSILILPVLLGVVLFAEGAFKGGTVLARVVAVAVLVLMIADSVPLFQSYYTLSTPPLRQVGAWVGNRPIWLVGAQSDLNGYYFPNSKGFGSEDAALADSARAPDFVLASVACGDLQQPVRFESAGYHRIQSLQDWTISELRTDQRPCYVLLQR